MEQQTASGSPLKWLAAQVAGGAALGFVASSLFGPAVISWWYEPPSRDAFSCAGSVRSALSQFVMMQLICAAVGGVALALIVFLVRRSLQKRAEVPSGAA